MLSIGFVTMNGVRIAVLLAATITNGWITGLFYAYSISVMPALRRADAAVFVEVMQRINTAILNGWCSARRRRFSTRSPGRPPSESR